jgi:hypothetical protein
MIRNRPALFDCPVVVVDSMSRSAKGKLLQIAAMAGVSKSNIKRLADAGRLSEEEVSKQLEVITSPEAVEANNQRNLVALNALKIFAIELYKIKENDSNKKDLYKKAIKNCRNDFLYRGIIESGYIFDRQIMIDALEFYQTAPMMQKMSSNQTDVFEEGGIKMIKKMLCPADQPPFTVVTIQELEEHFNPKIEKQNAACCTIM